jgi:hypothetical protein
VARSFNVSTNVETFSGNNLYVTSTHPRYLIVLGIAVLCYAALGTVLGILPDYVHSRGGDAVLVGLAVGAPALTGAAAATEQGAGIGSLVIPVFGVGVIASWTILADIPDRTGTRGPVAEPACARIGAAEPARPDRGCVLRLLRRRRRPGRTDRRSRGARRRPERGLDRRSRRRARDRARGVVHSGAGANETARVSYLSMPRAAAVQAVVTSRMNFAWVVASEEIHSTSLLPGPRSIEPAIAFSAFS